MSRSRGRRGLQVARGERYALVPREVLESQAYQALPPYAVLVLLALAVQYYGSRNGSLALPWRDAKSLGVRSHSQLSAGLQLLDAVGLIRCTRRGHLSTGKPLPSFYALTWHPVNEPVGGITYDAGLTMTLKPTNDWARWVWPTDWNEQVRTITARARGQLGRTCPYKKTPVSQREDRAAPSVRSGTTRSRSKREERAPTDLDPSVYETSKISGVGPHGAA